MNFDKPTIQATILKRYKRFLSDIELADGTIVNAHVPNTGSMKNCWEEGWKVLISESDNPKRKLKYTLEMTHNGESWISVNTSMTNKIANEAIEIGLIKELKGYQNIKPEKKVFESRIDFFLSGHKSKEDCYVEVKNVTLNQKQRALFPDGVSTRGQKHLKDLIELKKQGFRACMLYIVNREDVKSFSPAKDIDPEYARLLKEAKVQGVEILVYQTSLNEKGITVSKKLRAVI